LKISTFVLHRKKTIIQVWNDMRNDDNFLFWLNRSFQSTNYGDLLWW